MVLPKNPYRYAARLGNHPRLIAAIKAEEGSSLYPYKTADALRRLSLLLPQKPHEGSSAYAWMFFDTISPDALARYLQGFSNELMKTLYSARLLPLPGTLRMLERAGNAADMAQAVEETRNSIRSGGFDPANPVHMEFEYSRYRLEGPPESPSDIFKIDPEEGQLSFADFQTLPRIDGKKPFLGREEMDYAGRTALEAAAVFDVIKSKINGAPLLVIGNERYGSLFVVQPLEKYLDALGVKVVHERVSSFGSTSNGPAHLSDGTWKWIARHKPNVVVVDGTQLSEAVKGYWKDVKGPVLTRFPAAMWGYINAFREWNEASRRRASGHKPASYYQRNLMGLSPHFTYSTIFWSPAMKVRSPHFFVGGGYDEYEPDGESGDRELTIINSSCTGADNHSNAHFDNPERRMNYVRLGFTPHGLAARQLAFGEKEFVSAVQRAIKERIREYITL